MLPEIGYFLLIVAAVCAFTMAAPVFFASQNSKIPSTLWKPSLIVVFLCITISLVVLGWAFITNDFSVAYVANHSNTRLDTFYKIAAIWGSHEGSLLFWVWTIAAWTVLFAVLVKDEELFHGRTLAVMIATIGLFGLFLIFTSNPFERFLPLVPPEGKDLNPILQDIGLILHPPMLFMGYSGLALCFAISVASLVSGSLSKYSIRVLSVTSILAWVFLTAGNILGSWWAYNELGWGGWWFWDPVENSSFIPWLFVTAQLHALILTRHNAKLTRSVVLLCLLGFAVCLLGTFIVRSGVIQSVHAFASDPNRGTMLLIVSLLLVLPAFGLYMFRAHKMTGSRDLTTLDELSLAFAVILLSVSAISVLFGTLYPLVYDAFGAGVLSVGAPYFNSIFAPMAVFAAVLIGLTQLKDTNIFCWLASFLISSVLCVYFGFFTECKDALYTTAGVFACSWILSSFVSKFLCKGTHRNWFALIAHLGLAISIAGVVGDTQYQSEALTRLGPGLGRPLGDYIFVYEETKKVDEPSFFADEAQIRVLDKDEKPLLLLQPQRQTFRSNGMQMTSAGISHGLFRDLYVSLGNQLSAEEYLVRINIKPLVSWIWIGGIIMMLSAVFSTVWRRNKQKEEKNE